MQTKQQAILEFEANLNKLLFNIRQKAENQFKYNLETNVPRNILTIDQTAQHAINQGFTSAFNTVNGWDCDAAIRIAFDILEDCNAHTEAKALAKFIPEFA
jgi:hypothetical protein